MSIEVSEEAASGDAACPDAPDPSIFEQRLAPIADRVREALLFVIRQADRIGVRLTQYDILKSLFFADREHLRIYGRPITFDQLDALSHGPVPSLSYDALKGSLHAMRFLGIDAPLWQVEPAGGNKRHFFNAVRDADEDVLSESDIEELQAAVEKVRGMTFQQIWDESHADHAYKLAWERRGSAMAAMMRYDDLLGKEARERLGDVFIHAWNH